MLHIHSHIVNVKTQVTTLSEKIPLLVSTHF